MNFNDFLEEDGRFKYYILELLANKGNSYLSVGKLMDILLLSKYKVSNYLSEIKADCHTLNMDVQLEIYESGEIICENILPREVRLLRLHYLKQSNLFKIFEAYLCAKSEVNNEYLMTKLYVGQTKFYQYRSELIKLLEERQIKIVKNQLQGKEENIRLFAFEVYYYFYNGIEWPLEENKSAVKEISVFVSQLFRLSLAPTKKSKLDLFLSVQVVRLKAQNFLNTELQTNFQEKYFDQWNRVALFFKRNFQLSEECLRKEVDFLFSFLGIQEYLDKEIAIKIETSDERIDAVTAGLMKAVEESQHLQSVENLHSYLPELETALRRVNQKLFTFYIEPTTFISEEQITFFEESYPIFHEIIHRFLEGVNRKYGYDFSDEKKTNLYYDYMFVFLDQLPVDILPDKVYICIDFSQGYAYVRYIEKMLGYFSNLNIVIEKKVTSHTDIYISDFLDFSLMCEQIIWKNPPIALDWERLGNIIIKIKGEKV